MRAPPRLLWPSVVASLAGCIDWNAPHHKSAEADAGDAASATSVGADAGTAGDVDAARNLANDEGDAGAGDAAVDGADGAPDDADSAVGGGDASISVCPAAACPSVFPCVGDAHAYTCAGQFADFPVALRRAGESLELQRLSVDRDAGLVFDQVSGLLWPRVLSLQTRSYADASEYCSTLELGAEKAFRLPTMHELMSIANSERSPDLDTTVFVNVNTNPSYWTTTPDTESAVASHWTAGYPGDTEGESYPDDATRGVICTKVRASHVTGRADARFTLSADGQTVTDSRMQLVWEARVVASREEQTFVQAEAYCAGLLVDTRQFRLPSAAELIGIMDFSKPTGSRLAAPFKGAPVWSWTRTLVVDATPTSHVAVNASGSVRAQDSSAEDSLAGTRCVSAL